MCRASRASNILAIFSAWFSFVCISIRLVSVFRWFCLFESIAFDSQPWASGCLNCPGSRTCSRLFAFRPCYTCHWKYVRSRINLQPIHSIRMATRVNKAAGISSSLTMTYLFFIFQAIANHVSRPFCTVWLQQRHNWKLLLHVRREFMWVRPVDAPTEK